MGLSCLSISMVTRCCRVVQSIVQQCCERIDRTRGVACNRLLSIIKYNRYVTMVTIQIVDTMLFSPVIPHIPHHEGLLAVFNKYVVCCVVYVSMEVMYEKHFGK